MRSYGASGPAVASEHRPGHGLDLPMGEHPTGTPLAVRVAQPRTEVSYGPWALNPPTAASAPAAAPVPATPARPKPRAPRPPRPPVVDLDIPALGAAYTAGASLDDLAATTGVSRSTMHRRLSEAGVEMRPARIPPTVTSPVVLDIQALTAAYEADTSLAALARQFGASRRTITQRLRDAGVTIRPALHPDVARKLTAPAPPPSPPVELDAAAVRRLERRGLTTGQIATELGCTAADVHHHYAKPHRRSRTA